MSENRFQNSEEPNPIPKPIMDLINQAMLEEPEEEYTSAKDVIRHMRKPEPKKSRKK